MASHTSNLCALEPDDQYIGNKISAINRHRITWVLSILVVVHLAHIVMFWPYTHGASGDRELWRNGVIAVHVVLLTFSAVILPVKMLLERRKQTSRMIMAALPELVGLVYLLGGAGLAIVDQRVTSSINPLLIATTGVALVVVARPVVAVVNYALALVFFLVGVAWTQTNADLMLTIRVNSITATALGFGIALLQWRTQLQSLRQQRRIDDQQRELEEKNRELTLLATRDSLTGLMNRAQFMLDANREVMRMQRTGSTACLVMLDVDDFKLINDTYGHPVGDSILVEIARKLPRMLRSSDLLARFGGEEFTILLPRASVDEGLQVAEKLRALIAEQPFSAGGDSIRVTASFGVAEFPTGSVDALDGCYRAVDLALYQAKNDGRNCVRSGSVKGPTFRQFTNMKLDG